MPGTEAGGRKSADKILATDPGHYSRIGKMGSAAGDPKTRGFGAGELGRERARMWGRLGGSLSRRNRPEGEQPKRQRYPSTQLIPMPTQAQIRKQRRIIERELSQLQTAKLSEKYGKKVGWR
jgi:hypothetical protein